MSYLKPCDVDGERVELIPGGLVDKALYARVQGVALLAG